MNSIKVNKKDIESDDEDFEDFEEEEITNEEDYEDDEITSDEAKTEDEKEETIFKSFNILYEEYDLKRVCYLYMNLESHINKIYDKCKNEEELKKEENKLKNWLRYVIINDGKIEVIYKENEGRSFGKNSIQSISGYVRNFLLENKKVSDIDIENAICAILIPVFKKHNIECKTLEYYYQNRQEVINKLYKGNKQLCKGFINPSFFKNADNITPKNSFEKKIKKEIKDLQDFIFDLEEYENFNLKSVESCNKKGTKNFKGTMLYNLYAFLENEVLNEAIHFYKKETKKKVMVKMFDGFICEEDTNFNIDKLSDYISDVVNNKVIYTYKPIKNDINIIKPIPKDFNFRTEGIKASYYINKMFQNGIKFTQFSDGMFSEIILLFYSDNFIFQNEDIYIYYKNKWIKNNAHLIKSFIGDKITEIYTLLINNLTSKIGKGKNEAENNYTNETLVQVALILKKITFDNTKNNILNSLKTNLSKRLDKVEFDVSKPYAICFNNKAFDIRTGEEIEIHKLDYITFSTGYDYIKPTKKDMNEIETIIDNIFPNEETKKTYLSILWTCLSGIRQERFFMANGGGRNGKGLINELMLKMLGDDYSYTGHINTLTKELKSGPNPEMAQLNKKRFVKFEEPNDNDMLNLGNIKKITGEGFLNARNCNSNDTKCLLHLTAIFECNKKPNLNGTIDPAIIDRFVNIYFSSYFTKDKEELKNNPNAKPINTKYKQLEWQEKIRCAFFDYIIMYSIKDLYISDEIRQQTQAYLLDNDNIFSWFSETYEKTEEESILSIKDIMKEFKSSEFYFNLSKNDKRKNNEKNFKEKIQTNIELRKYFQERYKRIYYSVIIGWKLKQKDDDNEIDDTTI